LIGFCKYVGSWRNDIAREALERILGSLRWLKNLWFILLTFSTLLYVRLTFLHNQTRWSHVFIHVLCRITGMQGLMKWSIPRIPSSHLVAHVFYTCAFHMRVIRRITCSIQDEHVMCCDVTMFCHTYAFRIAIMRGKNTLHPNGGCLRLDTVHATASCMYTVSIVNGNVCRRFHDVLAWKVLFCRYTNNVS
jgi:hypothetical protein